MSHIKLISFDADDTLWNFRIMMKRGTEAVAAAIQTHYGEQFAHLTYKTLSEAQKAYILKHDSQTIDYFEARRVVFGQLMKEARHPNPRQAADELLEIYVTNRDQTYEFFEDALSTLAALRQDYKLAYLTNGTTHPAKAGIEAYFDVVVLCDAHVGSRKPRPEPFHYTASQAGVSVAEMVHVGDNLVADVGGANWVGARSVWFNPHAEENTYSNIDPHAEIHQLAEIIPLLANGV